MDEEENTPLVMRPLSWAGEELPEASPALSGSVKASAVNLAACALGASMLSLPYTMYLSGPVVAFCFLLIFGLMSYIASQAVVRAGEASGKSSYSAIIRYYFGPSQGLVIELLLAVALIVAAISYIVGLADLLPDMIPVLDLLDRISRIILIVVALYPVTLVGTLATFGPASTLGAIGCYLLALSFVLELFLSSPGTWSSPPWSVWLKVDISGLIFSMPMICFVFAYHYVLTDTLNELNNPTKQRMTRVNYLTVIILLACYIPVAMAGYLLKSGIYISSNILTGNRPKLVSSIVGTWAIGALLLFTYAIFIIPLRRKLEKLFFGRLSTSPAALSRLIIAALLNLFVCIVSIALPDLGVANTIAGGCIALIMYFFPGCLMVRLQLDNISRDRSIFKLILGSLFVFFGALICFVGLFGALLFEGY